MQEKKNREREQKHSNELQNFQILGMLGEGSYGRVRLVKKKKTGKYCCVKIMRKDQLIRSQQVDHVINECTILKSLNHPFVVCFEELLQTPKYVYLFMEYVPGGELFRYLKDEGMFQPNKTAFYTAQIVMVFQYLHNKNIVYRDLKPQNLLIASDGYLKLTDFGFAKVIDSRTFTLCGTPEYLAPQVLLNQGHGKAVDWWTLGVLIYEMIAGIDPFSDEDPLIIYQNILKGKIHYPKNFDRDAKSLVKHLLVNDLSKRYGNMKEGINDIKNHRYLNSISWQHLLGKKIAAPYKPTIHSPSDTSNFAPCSEVEPLASEISQSEDPFFNWSL